MKYYVSGILAVVAIACLFQSSYAITSDEMSDMVRLGYDNANEMREQVKYIDQCTTKMQQYDTSILQACYDYVKIYNRNLHEIDVEAAGAMKIIEDSAGGYLSDHSSNFGSGLFS